MADFASLAAATAAGYTIERWGPDKDGFYYTRLMHVVSGETGQDVDYVEGVGHDLTAALADTNAVAAVNSARSERYGFGEPGGELDDSGNPTVTDAT